MQNRPEMRSRGRNIPRGRGERGAALLEFALVAPLLLLFLYAIAAYGMVLAVKHGVTQAAADAARAAVPVTQDLPAESGPSAAAITQANLDLKWLGGNNPCNQAAFTCTATPVACPGSTPSSYCLQVTVKYDYQDYPVIPSLPGFGLFLPSSLSSSTTMLLSGPVPGS